ncbi:MAG: Ig-like domain-containing protein [Oscillospiraceae bacterium]|nr:Ig-like domain-containing protein [Oscillospiraceae bacterium]
MAFADEPNAKITWSSSSPTIASIVADTNDSTIATLTTSNSAGSTNIKATANNGNVNSNIVNLAVTNTSAPPPKTATPMVAKISVDGSVDASLCAYNIDGNNYFKLRDIAEIIKRRVKNNTTKQFDVEWVGGSNNRVNLIKNKEYTYIQVEFSDNFITWSSSGSKTVNESTHKFFVSNVQVNWAAYLINGFNYVKLRDVMETVDINVVWDSTSETTRLDTSKGYQEPNTFTDCHLVGYKGCGRCVDLWGTVSGEGDTTKMSDWANTDQQRWSLVSENGKYYLKSARGNYYLGYNNKTWGTHYQNSNDHLKLADITSSKSTAAEITYEVVNQQKSYYRFKKTIGGTEHYLTMTAGSTSNDNVLVWYSEAGRNDQIWKEGIMQRVQGPLPCRPSAIFAARKRHDGKFKTVQYVCDLFG